MSKLIPKHQKGNYMQTSTGKVANFQLPEVEVTAESPTGDAWKDRNLYKAYKGRRYINNGRQETSSIISGLAELSPVGDVMDAMQIGKDINSGNYSQATLGTSMFLLPNVVEKPLRRLLSRSKGLKVIYPNRFQKIMYPYQSKKLDELHHARQFIKDSNYDYVTNNTVNQAITSSNNGTNLFRGVGNGSTPYRDLMNTNDFSSQIELFNQNTRKSLYDKIPDKTTWMSTSPAYTNLQSREIHIQPESDFWFKVSQISGDTPARRVNSYDPRSRIVNADGINLNSGHHFIKIPKANNSFAVMKDGINYDLSPAYQSPIKEQTRLLPGIYRTKDGWDINKGYKLGTLGLGISGLGIGSLYESPQLDTQVETSSIDSETFKNAVTELGRKATPINQLIKNEK